MARTSRTTGELCAGCSKRLSCKAAASEEARRTLRYVEPLSEARTMLADFFSILLVVGLGVARKLALLDFFLVAPERLQRIGLEMGIGFDKLRHEIIE